MHARPASTAALRIALASLLCAAPLLAAIPRAALADATPPPPPEAVLGDLPMLPGFPTRAMVDLAPEGQTAFRMILDTGASQSVLTPVLARQLGVTVRVTKSTPYRKKTSLGRDLLFYVDTRTSDTGSKTGWEYGLLGGDFLDDYVLELDYPGQRVRFLDPKRYRVPEQVSAPDERVIPFERSGTRVLVPIEIDGREAHVMLDTGAPDTFILSGRVAKKLGIDVASLPSFGEVGTVMGAMEVRLLETDTFRYAGFDFDRMPGLVAPKGWYNMGASESVIGFDVLRQFVTRIDYKRKRIWMARRETRITFGGADYASAKRVGAWVAPLGVGEFKVFGVEPGGPADARGLRAGDVMVGEKELEALLDRIEDGEIRLYRPEGDDWALHVLPAAPKAAASPAVATPKAATSPAD